jgi:hypothetical protein
MAYRRLWLGVVAGLAATSLVLSCTLITGLPDLPTRAEGGTAVDATGDSTLDATSDSMGAKDGKGESSRDAASEAGPCDAGGDPCACLVTPTLILQGAANVHVMTVDGDSLYWLGDPGGYDPFFYGIEVDSVDASLPPYAHNDFAWGSGSDEIPYNSKYFYFDIGDSTPYLAEFPVDDAGVTIRLTPNLPILAEELRVGARGIYWTNNNSEICAAELDGSIPAGDSGCGGKALAVTPDGGLNSYYNRLALADASVFQAIYNTGEIRSVPVGGGVAQEVAMRAKDVVRPLFASDTDLVWSESVGDAGTVFHALPDGGDVTTPLITAPIAMFVVDSTDIYVLTKTPGRVMKVPLAGGALDVLACPNTPQLLAVDGTRVYWWSGFDNTFHSVPK